MENNWQRLRLDDVVDFFNGDRGKNYPSGDDFVSHGIPFINAGHLVDGRIEWTSANYISQERFSMLRGGRFIPGDLLFCLRGSIGRVARVDQRGKIGTIASSLVIIRVKSNQCNAIYLYYVLTGPAGQSVVKSLDNGAAQPNISVATLSAIQIPLPPLPTQRRIASVLSAYDDLIENNTRRIKILEETARALYREWFVEFRFPGHEKVRMVDSEQGKIPEGWEVKSISNFVWINPRVKVDSGKENFFVPMNSLSNDSMIISEVGSRQGNSGSKFMNGDTVFARITPCLENGKTGFVQFLPDENCVAFGSTEFIVFRSKSLSPEAVYCLCRSDEFRAHAIKSMTGATGRQRVQEKCFDNFMFAKPTSNLLANFSSIAAPIFKMIQHLDKRNQTLRRTRDLLLPRLMSGEVDVSRVPLPAEVAEAEPEAVVTAERESAEPVKRGRGRPRKKG